MESRRGKRDSLAKLKLLGGMLRLGKFSARELASHADVKSETARAFAEDRRRDGILETIEAVRPTDPASKRSGRPENVYQLKPEHRRRILDDIVQVRRSIAITPTLVSGPDRQDEEDFSPLALLESDLASLETDTFEDADDRIQRLDQARIRLSGAEADFEAMAGSHTWNVVEQFAVRLNRAREALQIESERKPPSQSDYQVSLPANIREWITAAIPANDDGLLDYGAVMHFLVDWSVSVQSSAGQTSRAIMWTTADQRPADWAYLSRNVLFPMDHLMRTLAGWPQSKRQASGQEVVRELGAASAAEDEPARVMKLAISAALVDATEAAEPLLLALLRPGMMEALSAQGRELCWLAMARLARPSASAALSRAAGACLLLLNRDIGSDMTVPILLPAALQSANVNERSLLNLFAATLYEKNGLAARWQPRIDESAILRNLGWVIHASKYSVLQQHISHLFDRDYGAALLKALISPANGALRFVDRHNGEPFAIRPGRILAEQAGLMEEDTPLAFGKKINDRLLAMRTETNWDDQGSSDQSEDDFLSQLGDRRRPAFSPTVIEGGRR